MSRISRAGAHPLPLRLSRSRCHLSRPLTKGNSMAKTPKIGLDGLLRPDNSVLVLIDHQPYQFANLHSHEPTMIVNNVIALAQVGESIQRPDDSLLGDRGARRLSHQGVFRMSSRTRNRSIAPSSTPGKTRTSPTSSRRPGASSSCWPRSTQRFAWRCRQSRRSPTDMTCSLSPMRRAASRRRPTIWPCAAWSPPVRCRSPGSPCSANGNVIGRVKKPPPVLRLS